MKKLIFIPIIGLCCYFYTAVYSLNQIHKGIFYNDKNLIREYIEWKELRQNFNTHFEHIDFFEMELFISQLKRKHI